MAIGLIQNQGNNGLSLSSISVGATQGWLPTSAGSLLVACIGTLTKTVSSISGGGTWVRADGVAQGSVNCEIWYAPNSSAGVATITVTLSGADAVAVSIHEWSGLALAIPLERLGASAHTAGAASNPQTGSPSAFTNVVLEIVAANYIPTTSTVSSQTAGFTALTGENASTSLALVDSYLVSAAAADAKNNTWTLTPAVATAWAATAVLFVPPYVKWYLHDAATADAGTLPGAGTTTTGSATTTVTGASTNRSLDNTPGAGQTSVAFASAAATAQSQWVRRFCSGPIGGQSLLTTSAGFQLHYAAQQSNTNANFAPGACCVIWRPSTGVVVGRFVDIGAMGLGQALGGTVEAWPGSNSANTTAVTVLDGDIIVVEVWNNNPQGMTTSYTDTFYYDGTTEGSSSTAASFIEFANAILPAGAGPVIRTASPFGRKAVMQAINRASSYFRRLLPEHLARA